MANKHWNSKKKLPKLEKNVTDFLLNEEGKISKKNIAKIGVTLAILGLTLNPQNALAGSHSNHANHSSGDLSHSSALVNHASGSGTGGHDSSTPHGNHANHSNSHSSHSSGGWC